MYLFLYDVHVAIETALCEAPPSVHVMLVYCFHGDTDILIKTTGKLHTPNPCAASAAVEDSAAPTPEPDAIVAPSSDVPLVLTGAWRMCVSVSVSRGEETRCVSMRAEKRRRTPGGLESDSVKEYSEQDRRFLHTHSTQFPQSPRE